MRFFHGGAPGLSPGESVLPPIVTGRTDTLLDAAQSAGLESPQRRDRVYVSTDVDAALMYACTYPFGRGFIYEVAPVGDIEEDPDCTEVGLSYQCASAKVISGRAVTKREARDVLRVLGLPPMPWMKAPKWSRRKTK